jgi:peptide/nickel transport system substrate-binding protein
MASEKKSIRFYYWIVSAFLQKNLKLILLSFFLSFVIIIAFISLSPFFESFLSLKREINGIVGKYDYNNLPEEITTKISNGLLYINEKGEFIPTLASSWEIKNDGKQYRFILRDGLIWSDGTKFTSKDIIYQFKDIVKSNIDDRTFYFVLNKPLPIFPTYLTKPIIKYPLVGVAGLYRVKNIVFEYDSIKEIFLEPNKKDLPAITYKFFNTEAQMITAYKKGEITTMNITKKSVADVFKSWNNTRVTKVVDYSRLFTIFFNLDNQILKEKEIRQALNEAINRDVLKDFGELAVGPIPPTSWAYDTNLKNPMYDFDSSLKTFQKNNMSTKSAELTAYTYYDYLDIADVVYDFFKKLGLSITVNTISYEKPNNFDLLLAYWKVPSDPDQYFYWHSTQKNGNIGNYKNVKVDLLLEEGRKTLDVKERKQIYFQYQKIIMDDPPAIFLYYPYIYTIKRR